MKNIILGIIGTFLVIYTAVISLTVYGVQSRKNEVENVLSGIVTETLAEYYVPEILRDEKYVPANRTVVENTLSEELLRRITSDSDVQITIIACDMDKGILSARVDETYFLPNGTKKTWSFAKTAIVDQEVTYE